MRFLGGSQGMVGLDIGSSAIKLVQVTSKRDGYDLQNLSTVSVPSEAIVDGALMNFSALGEAVGTLVKDKAVKARKAACSISGNAVIAKVVTMPAMGKAEMDEQIQWEAEQHIPFSIQDVNLDYQILARREGEMSILLVAAKKEILADYEKVVAEAGLELSVVDIDALAMFNCFYANHYLANKAEFAHGLVALVNVGASMTNILMVRDGVPTFLRDVPTGGNIVTTEIQKGLQLSFEEAEAVKTGQTPVQAAQQSRLDQVLSSALSGIVGEIQRTADFYLGTAGEETIGRYLVTGGTTRAPGMFDLLREKLGVEVEPLNPFQRVHADNARFSHEVLDGLAAVSSIGLGLALRQSQDAFKK